MDQAQAAPAADKPLWKRIIDFPLVAMVIAVALFIAANAAGIFIGNYLPPMNAVARLALTAAIDIALVLAVYKLAIVRLGEHPRDDLKPADAPKNLGLGLLIGFVMFCAIVGVAAVVDVYNIVGKGSASQLLKVLILAAILPGFMEEVLFRGILFRWIEEFAGSWVALALTAALFGLAHILNPNATWFSSVAIAMEAGVLLGGAYMLTRNLWMPIGLHAAWNFTQGFIFDVPVSGLDEQGLVTARLTGPEILSGGAFGLEASIIAVVIATGAGLWLVWLAVRRGELMQPWWVRRKRIETVAT
ncbi:MAG: CPBP family intramembrane glutamic endopeptidase [Sphingomicrobium sp.]